MLVIIRGAGDIATGIALRLWRAKLRVIMTDLEQPTAIRRTVCFPQAIPKGEAAVEDVTAKRAEDPAQALMVGDRKFDVLGARACGVDCAGVEFFGYAPPGELEEAGAMAVFSTAEELERFILSH